MQVMTQIDADVPEGWEVQVTTEGMVRVLDLNHPGTDIARVLAFCTLEEAPSVVLALAAAVEAQTERWVPVELGESSNIKGASYFEARAQLRVTFHNGRTYEYFGVEPAVVETWRRAPSVGQFFNQVRRKAEDYPCRELTETPH